MSPKVLAFVLITSITPGAIHPVVAQTTRTTISGLVADASSAVVPGATVSALHQETQVEVTVTTNERGLYRIPYLDPGPYVVKATRTGFKTVGLAVQVRVGTDVQVDFTLEVGSTSESVEVTSAAPLLETANANRGVVIDNRRINTIPLAQGNPIFLLALTNGSNPGANSNAFKFDEPAYTVAGGFSFQGAPPGTNSFTLNGLNNVTTAFGGSADPALQPPTDAVEEFKVSQSFSAQQGHGSGTSIDIALRGGSNGLHGSLYAFFRDGDWGANSFSDNLAGNPKPDQTYKRIGGTATGPIVKNRTFWAFTTEVTRQKSLEIVGTETVPSPEQLNGNFSQLLAAGSQFQIYDPYSTQPTGTGFFRREPFPNNIIPASRINPVSKKLSEFWPKPNTQGGRDGSSNFQPNFASPTNFQQVFSRVDHNFYGNTRLFYHFGTLWSDIQWKDTFNNLSTGHIENIKKQSHGLDFVHVLNASTLINLRYGLVRVRDPRFEKHNCAQGPQCFDIATLGLDPNFVRQLDLTQSSLPHIFIEGYRGISDDIRNNLDASDVHSFSITSSHSRASHNISFGFETWQQRFNSSNNTFVMPRYAFGSDFTKGPLNTSAPAPTGQGLAAFLLGQQSGGFVARRDNFASHNPYYAMFVEEDWRATRKLTLNFGLRVEYYGSVTERFNRSTRGFDFNSASPVEQQARAAYATSPIPELPVDQFRVLGGLLFAGVGGQPRELYESVGILWAPRFGLAYRLRESTIFRGGYGIYYLPVGVDGNRGSLPHLDGFSRNTDFVPTLNEGVTFIANIANPVPGGIQEPAKAQGGLSTNLGQTVGFGEVNKLKAPYMQRWSASFQQLLPSQVLLDLAYVGSRGTKLIVGRNLNALPNRYLSTRPFRDSETISFLSQSFPNPFAGLLPGSSLNTSLTNRTHLLTALPQFRTVSLEQVNQGYSWYHAFEAKLEKRFSRGHSYIASYTWSKDMEAMALLNSGDAMPHETLSGRDRAHRLSVTAIVELPFGRGRSIGSSVSPTVNHVIGGWEVSTAWQLHSGFPLSWPDLFTDGNLQNVALSGGDRRFERWFNTEAGFVRNSAQQPAFHFRTFPLRFGNIRSDILNLWDISIIKNIRVAERHNVEFQAQFLNAFNHPSFAGVNTNPASGSFGRVTGDMTWARRVMFGVRYRF